MNCGQRLGRPRRAVAASLGLVVGECPPGVEGPGNLAGALAIHSGQKRVCWPGETPRRSAAGKLGLGEVRAACRVAVFATATAWLSDTAIEFSFCRL